MNKKKLTKATSGLLLTALMVGGAAAFLSTSQTGTKTNSIKIGQITVVFDNQQDVIALTDMYPMTRAYAEANLTPYTFTVDNDGDIDVLYSLRAVTEEGAEIDASLIDLILDDGSIVKLSESNLLKNKALRHGTSDAHKLLAYIDETAVNDDVVGKATSFHLELNATQINLADSVTIANVYNAVQKSALETSITVDGQTKQVETYNIEGDSKTQLLEKLEESGLANAADVDAIIEVKGEDYDGINSTAEFDVSSIANEGDTVVILHFNESTGEWEYIGTETVDGNGKVSGEFTSYSPVAFVVVDKNGNIVSTNTSEGGSSGPGEGTVTPSQEGSAVFYTDDSLTETVTYTWEELKAMYPSVTDTEIGTRAFVTNKLIKEIVIPEGVTSIGDSAFLSCTNLTSVLIPEGMRTIGDTAFWNCANLTTVTLPSTLETVGPGAFRETGLTEIVIPEGITSIEKNTFYDCANLTSVTLPSTLKTIGSFSFRDTGLTEIVIPEGVTSIEEYAFSECTNLTSIALPSTLETMGNSTFRETGLTEIVIPEGITSIEDNAFYNSTNLTSVTLPSTLETIGISAFASTGLTEIVIPEGVTSIGDNAFSGCANLTSVVIPEGVTSIGNTAFSGCTNLTSVALPSTLQTIGVQAFYADKQLSNINFNGTFEQWNAVSKGSNWVNSTTVIIHCSDGDFNKDGVAVPPESGGGSSGSEEGPVTPAQEGSAVFYTDETHTATVTYSWDELKAMYPSVTDTEIKIRAFNKNTLIKEVVLPDGVTTIGTDAFSGCTNLTSVALPSTLQTVDTRAFKGCTSLTNIAIPEGVTTIGADAFSGCTNLTNITLPSTVQTIDVRAFYQTGLTEIVIPDGVTSIEGNTFYGCTNLTTVTLPSTLQTIGLRAFSGCTSLTNISYSGTAEQWNAVSKGSDWAYNAPATQVQCSDGTVAIN